MHQMAEIDRLISSLREQESRLRAVLDVAVVGIVTIDQEAIVRDFNPAAERMFGWSAGEVIGRNVSILMPSPQRDQHDRYVSNYLETGVGNVVGRGRETVAQRRDGSTFPIFLGVNPFDVAGSRHFAGVIVDLSDRHHLDDQMRDAEQRLRSTVDLMPEAFALWDAADRLVLCNGRYRDCYPLVADLMVPGVAVETLLDAMAARRQHDLPVQELVTWRQHKLDTFRAGGLTREQLADGRVLLVAEARLITGGGVATLIRDVTDAGTDAIDDIGTRLKHRALELAALATHREAARRDAQRVRNDADTLGDTRARFVNAVSHKLRTPLNAIIGFSEMLMNEELGPRLADRVHAYSRDIHESARLLLSLMDELLNFSAVGAGQFELQETVVDLIALVDEAIGRVRQAAMVKQVVIARDLPRSQPAMVDSRLIGQVMTNVLASAVRLASGGGTIRVSLEFDDEGGVQIVVSDDGVGMTRDAVARIREPFDPARPAGSHGAGAGGLDLAISSTLVELHGGRLDIGSRIGVGTVVSIHLPAERVCLMVTAQAAQ